MLPSLLNATSAAKPLYAVCVPCDRPTAALIGAPEGVASNCAVKVPVWVAKERFCQVAPAVTQTTGVGVGVGRMGVGVGVGGIAVGVGVGGMVVGVGVGWIGV